MAFDGIDDGFKVFQTRRDVFQKELVFDGETVQKQAVDGECAKHPVLGGVVAEWFGVADEVLVLFIAFNADAEHVLNGLAEAVESGARQGFALIQVVCQPQLLNAFKRNSLAALQGVDNPNILSKSVGVSHGGMDFLLQK